MASIERQVTGVASQEVQVLLSQVFNVLIASRIVLWKAWRLEPLLRKQRKSCWRLRKDGTLRCSCKIRAQRKGSTVAVQKDGCEDYVLYWLYNLTSLHSLQMARKFLRQEQAPEDMVLQSLHGYHLPWRSMRHAVHVYNVFYLISQKRALERSKRENKKKRRHVEALRAATTTPPTSSGPFTPSCLPEAVPSQPLCPSIGQRVITVVTTAALPWLTGTSINPLLRAAYLERLEHVKVILMVPWLEASDQRIVYPKDLVFSTPALQETYIRKWLLDRLGLHVTFRILFYPARFNVVMNSIFTPGGFDLTSLVPSADADIAVLEEPEHLCWYHFGPKWRQVFRLVVGVVHTNYVEYVKRTPVDKGGGPVLAFLLWFVNVWRTRANCHLAIRLSEGVQYYADSVVCNVHGVAPHFLSVPLRQSASEQTGASTGKDSVLANRLHRTNTASLPTKEDSGANPSVSSEGRSRESHHRLAVSQDGEEPPLVFDKGCYFIGKMLWPKGYRELCDLLLDYCKRQRGEHPSPPERKRRRFPGLPFRIRPVETKRRGGTGLYQKGQSIGIEARFSRELQAKETGSAHSPRPQELAHSPSPQEGQSSGAGVGVNGLSWEQEARVFAGRSSSGAKSEQDGPPRSLVMEPVCSAEHADVMLTSSAGVHAERTTRGEEARAPPQAAALLKSRGKRRSHSSLRTPVETQQVDGRPKIDMHLPSKDTSAGGRGIRSAKESANGLSVIGLEKASAIRVQLRVEGLQVSPHALVSETPGPIAEVTSADVSERPQDEAPSILVDCFGTGAEEEEIFDFVAKYDLPIKFHGRRDHADPSIWGYKVFVNPSCSDVLCTTTAEALAMGKFVVIADHPSNIFFAENFPENTVLYNPDVPEEFGQALLRALAASPVPLTSAQRRTLTWEAATERFMSVAKLL